MASGKIPKLIVKRHYTSSRKLKLPDEVVAEQQDDLLSGRSSRVSRRTVAIRQAKTSLRSHFHLIAIGLCAAIVMYGIAASLTAGEKKPADTGTPEPTAEAAKSVMIVPVEGTPNMVKRIEIDNVKGTRTKMYRVEKENGVTRYIPVVPKKPKPTKSSYDDDKKTQKWDGDAPY